MIKIYKLIRLEVRAVMRWIFYKLACREALRLHRLNGKQYFVVPTRSLKFIIINNSRKNNYNKVAKKMGLKKVTFLDLCNKAYFYTPAGKIHTMLPERRGHGK
jgi:hypothetical protein